VPSNSLIERLRSSLTGLSSIGKFELILALIGFFGTIGTLLGLVLVYVDLKGNERAAELTQRQISEQSDASQKQFKLAQDNQIADRFSRAVSQLGSDEVQIRLGGIYALERIAQDSERDEPTVADVLTAFIRERQRWSDQVVEDNCDRHIKPPTDVQTTIIVLGRLPVSNNGSPRPILILTNVDLRGAEFARGNYEGAVFYRSHLDGAYFYRSKFAGAQFDESYLDCGYFVETDMTEAFMFKASLRKAGCANTSFQGADFAYGDLTQSSLICNLTNARFNDAIIRGARFALDPNSHNGTAIGLDQAQIDKAIGDGTTVLPYYIRRPDFWGTGH
jgi:hypothetical protein